MFILNVWIKPLFSKGQNSERGRKTCKEKGSEGVPVSSSLFHFLVIFLWNQDDLLQYLGQFSEE